MKKTYPTSKFKDDSQYFEILDGAVMQQKQLTEQMIKTLHHHILGEKDATATGVYHEIDVFVGNHCVMPPHEIANAMVEFCIWFNTTQKKQRHGRSYICSQCT
ncbi:hypothetical protein niasHT_021941 [Heterodera trifolii]|uniref:Uncharacterized protein n=1 Tax=Heterodera trifolii TaxID=157864 RepID=A0ABD2JHA4_9BILA